MKLKDTLRESVELGRLYSNPFATAFVKENEEVKEEASTTMNTEQKEAFLEAVKAYKTFGESVYRKEGLSDVYESIKGLVEVANKVTIKETGDWFDGVTVARHMKRMNESFRVFEKTLKEVSTLQQRLESSYDEIGEVLGKYYEINDSNDELVEGNTFGAARTTAIKNGDSEFTVDGKTYPVTDVGADDKENAKEFKSESMKLTDLIKKSVNEAGDFAGWVAIDHKGNRLEIKKSEAKDLYNAKLLAIKKLKVPKSKIGLLAIKPAVDESVVSEAFGNDRQMGILYTILNNNSFMDSSDFNSFFKKLQKDSSNYFKGETFALKKLHKDYKANPKGFTYDDNKYHLEESVVNEAKYDIGMARKGSGLTIYNKAEEENGDYKTIAHIDNKGKVTYFDKKLPNNIKKEIEKEMAKMKESVTEGNTMKLKSLLNESYGFGELPSEKLIKMKVSAKDMLDSVKNNTPIAETKLNEGGFATWEMSFSDMNIGGVTLSKKNVYKVKARNTVEAIQKAAKMAGVKGNDWMATQTHSLKKIG